MQHAAVVSHSHAERDATDCKMMDRVAGYRAGAATVLLANQDNEHLKEHDQTGLWIDRLDELIRKLEEGFAEDTRGRPDEREKK